MLNYTSLHSRSLQLHIDLNRGAISVVTQHKQERQWPDMKNTEITQRQPNILFIYLDDLGYGDLSCFNLDSKIQTPNIDRIAREGIAFTDAHAPAAICGPSRYGLMTGRYPWRRGAGGTGNGEKFRDLFMERGRMTIASLLKEEGYNTAQMGKWGIRHDYSAAVKPGREPGSIDAYDFPARRLLGSQLVGFNYSWVMTHLADEGETKHLFENGLPIDPEWQTRPSDPYCWLPDSAMKVVEYIETFAGDREYPAFHIDREKPFFVYWDPPSPHEPIVPNKAFVGTSGAGAYGDFVQEIDHYVGKMLDALDRSGLAENTIVIFSSDNGPESSAYERARAHKHYSMGNLRGVKRDTWEGGHRVPLLVRWPGIVESGSQSDELISLTDWFATFTEMIGRQLPEDAGEDSISFLQLLKGEQRPVTRKNMIHHTLTGRFAIRASEWVYIDNPTGNANRAEPEWFRNERGVKPHGCPGELFNLAQDPRQTQNLHNEHPEIVKELKHLLEHQKKTNQTRDRQ